MRQTFLEEDLLKPNSSYRARQLAEGVHYFQSFLTQQVSLELLYRLWAELNWQQRAIRLFGKEVMQPRLICWQSDPEVNYSYSGLRMEPTAWHPSVAELRSRLHRELGLHFNSVLLNAYRNGQDSMGWHADDEPELGPNPPIASISLGAPRKFLWREKPCGKSSGMELQQGSLLLMSGSFQDRCQHSVPKTRRKSDLRINLTFRRICPR